MRFSMMLAACAALATAAAGRAGTIIPIPDAAYVTATQVVGFADPDEALIGSISGSGVTIGFSTLMRASTVGDNWASWGSPPDSESSTPRVLWSELDANFDPITSVTFTLSNPASIFGFEAEPGPTDIHTITATFFMSGAPVETISLDVSGSAGARLFAAAADQGTFFDSVTVTSDADWAAGQFRFAPFAAPEPRPFGLIPVGMAGLLAISRKLKGLQ